MTEGLSEAAEEVPNTAETNKTVVPFKSPNPASFRPEGGVPDPLQVEIDPKKYCRVPRIERITRLRLTTQGTWGAAADEELRIIHHQYVKMRVVEKRSIQNATSLIVSQQYAELRRSLMSQSYRIAAVILMAAAVILAALSI